MDCRNIHVRILFQSIKKIYIYIYICVKNIYLVSKLNWTNISHTQTLKTVLIRFIAFRETSVSRHHGGRFRALLNTPQYDCVVWCTKGFQGVPQLCPPDVYKSDRCSSSRRLWYFHLAGPLYFQSNKYGIHIVQFNISSSIMRYSYNVLNHFIDKRIV